MTNILDTVEPDGYLGREIAEKLHARFNTVTTITQHCAFHDDVAIYSRETVDRLLAEHRKQVLLEAAEVCADFYKATGFDAKTCADELRRMAEGEK
jgi:nucleoside-diphosphate-sugar epimerase